MMADLVKAVVFKRIGGAADTESLRITNGWHTNTYCHSRWGPMHTGRCWTGIHAAGVVVVVTGRERRGAQAPMGRFEPLRLPNMALAAAFAPRPRRHFPRSLHCRVFNHVEGFQRTVHRWARRIHSVEDERRRRRLVHTPPRGCRGLPRHFSARRRVSTTFLLPTVLVRATPSRVGVSRLEEDETPCGR